MKRIKQISVKNLFGMFNHTIPLNLDERITILHSPNGFGKTAVFKLLSGLFSQNHFALRSIPFDEFRVHFDDGTDFWVDKAEELHDEYEKGGRFPPSFQEVTFHFIDTVQGRLVTVPPSSFNVVLSSGRYGPQDAKERAEISKNRELLRSMRQSVSLRLIETQRLQNTSSSSGKNNEGPFGRITELPDGDQEFEEQPPVEATVTSYSQELAEIIKTKLAESTVLSQSLDRKFPAKLVNPTEQQRSVTEDVLLSKLMDLERKRTYLMDVGLLDQDDSDAIQVQRLDQINESTKVVLSVYVEDAEEKLRVFDELASKIDLLKRIINKRFLYKEMTISKDQGFVFTNSKGVVLSPTDLSSGEQHELILFYELLFKVAPDSLILIDEPEISLHVVWQEQFLEDVQAVTRLANIDVLLATHSPDIIADRRNLMVELKGPK